MRWLRGGRRDTPPATRHRPRNEFGPSFPRAGFRGPTKNKFGNHPSANLAPTAEKIRATALRNRIPLSRKRGSPVDLGKGPPTVRSAGLAGVSKTLPGGAAGRNDTGPAARGAPIRRHPGPGRLPALATVGATYRWRFAGDSDGDAFRRRRTAARGAARPGRFRLDRNPRVLALYAASACPAEAAPRVSCGRIHRGRRRPSRNRAGAGRRGPNRGKPFGPGKAVPFFH